MSQFLVCVQQNRTLFLQPALGVLTEIDRYGQPIAQTLLDLGRESIFMACLLACYGETCPYEVLLAAQHGGEEWRWRKILGEAMEEKRATPLLHDVTTTKSRVQKKLVAFSFEIVLEKYVGYALLAKERNYRYAA